ncbi:MAG: hypothetical protein JKY37_02700 [Nannocystaceae bacterium]|nr:hypothetical protein [Nannocystaceae bacterium]
MRPNIINPAVFTSSPRGLPDRLTEGGFPWRSAAMPWGQSVDPFIERNRAEISADGLGRALVLGECLRAAVARDASDACVACAASME